MDNQLNNISGENEKNEPVDLFTPLSPRPGYVREAEAETAEDIAEDIRGIADTAPDIAILEALINEPITDDIAQEEEEPFDEEPAMLSEVGKSADELAPTVSNEPSVKDKGGEEYHVKSTTLVAPEPVAPAHLPTNEINSAAALQRPRRNLSMEEVEQLPNRDREPLVMPDNMEAGEFLRRTREEIGISARYITAIEQNDLGNMPPPVYAIAYIRKLSEYYNINKDSAEKMVESLRSELNREIPDTLMSRVEFDTEAAEENEREVRKLLWLLGGGFAAFIVVGALLGLWLLSGNPDDADIVSANGGAVNAAVEAGEIERLLPHPALPLVELPPK